MKPTQTKRQRIVEWSKLIAITGSAQVMVQAIGFICGILVIRLLPIHEYALYTLANTMLGTMTLLADGGIATGVMSQGGKVWQDKQKLGGVLVTGMQLRKKFAVFSLLVATPVLFYLLRKHDASWLMSSMIVLSLIPAFFTSLSGTLLEIPIKLHQDIKPLQKIQVFSNIGRLALLGLSLFAYPFAAVAIGCAGGSQIWSNWRLRKISKKYVDRNQSIDIEVHTEILAIVRRIFPGAVYYTFSGQITIWLQSFIGTTESVAQIGALSRLTMMLNIIGILFGTLFVPRFAKLPDIRSVLTKRYIQVQLFMILLSCAIVFTVWKFPSQLLWVLGKGYSGLSYEVVLIASVSCITMVSGSAYSMSVARGLVVSPLFVIPLGLVIQALLLWIIHPDSLAETLIFSLLQQVLHASIYPVFFLFSIQRLFP